MQDQIAIRESDPLEGEVMFIGALRYIKWDQLSDAERDKLRQHLEEQRAHIRQALRHVNRNLKSARKKPKRKRVAKPKRKAKRGRR